MDQQRQYDSEKEMNEHHEHLFNEAIKTLSPTQLKVIESLLANEGSYIHKSQYYNHNRVVSKEPFQHEYGFETRELMQFSRPTLECLIKANVISLKSRNIYTLTL